MPDKKLSFEQRIRILSLRTNGGLSQTKINEALGVSRSTVRAVLRSGFLTPQKPKGRPCILNTTLCRRLPEEQLLTHIIDVFVMNKLQNSKGFKLAAIL
ncbi:hypothetical protein K3495_g6190 [Podosphaera aphanis]|nr:hypothetical protein K3495_g6190 [Podosphaera aphanis]